MARRQRTLTEADKRAAALVRALWAEYQTKNPGISQEAAAGRAGMTQSAFSQFLRGTVPMRVTPVIKFANLFGVDAREIRDDLSEVVYRAARETSVQTAREPAMEYRAAEQTHGRRVAERLLAIVTTFLNTGSDGQDELYAQARAVADADKVARTAGRAEQRARRKRR